MNSTRARHRHDIDLRMLRSGETGIVITRQLDQLRSACDDGENWFTATITAPPTQTAASLSMARFCAKIRSIHSAFCIVMASSNRDKSLLSPRTPRSAEKTAKEKSPPQKCRQKRSFCFKVALMPIGKSSNSRRNRGQRRPIEFWLDSDRRASG